MICGGVATGAIELGSVNAVGVVLDNSTGSFGLGTGSDEAGAGSTGARLACAE